MQLNDQTTKNQKTNIGWTKHWMQMYMLTFWLVNQQLLTNKNVMNLTYHNVVIINTLQLEACLRYYKMIMKEEFDVY